MASPDNHIPMPNAGPMGGVPIPSNIGVPNVGGPQGPLPPAPTTADQTSIVSGGGKHGAGTGGKGVRGKGKGKGKGKHGGKTGGKARKRDKMSRAARAELNFPVGRIHSRLKDGLLRKQRCGASAAIYTAALLEYLTSEVLELAGAAAKAQKTDRIKPRHLMLAIRGDEELNQIVNATISGGGVVPSLHKALEKKTKKKSKRSA